MGVECLAATDPSGYRIEQLQTVNRVAVDALLSVPRMRLRLIAGRSLLAPVPSPTNRADTFDFIHKLRILNL